MSHRVCPFLVGYLLIFPLRRLYQNPENILRPYVSPGMTVMDVGSAMGFFSLPMAAMVGPRGKVFCLDVQEKMLLTLRKRAVKAKLEERILPRLCRPDSLDVEDLAESVDFALAFAVAHEVPDERALFADLFRALKPDAPCLVAEPRGHVSKEEFLHTLSIAEHAGFRVLEAPPVAGSHTALLITAKQGGKNAA